MGTARAEDRRRHGLFPSRDVDLKTALELFEWSHYRFARSTEAMPPEQTEAILAALVAVKPKDPAVLFLQAAGEWRPAVTALKVFGAQFAWGSKQKRDKLTVIAKNPHLVTAAQVAAVGAANVPDEYLAVLALDGSTESMDALLPHFARALQDPTRLDSMEKLSRYAKKTEALTALLDEVTRRRRQRTEDSPSLALARQLGIASSARFRVQVLVKSIPKDEAHLSIELDSNSPGDHRVRVLGRKHELTFDADLHTVRADLRGWGRCALPELPEWLARTQVSLGVRWNPEDLVSYELRGKRLEVFLSWLFAPSRAPAKRRARR